MTTNISFALLNALNDNINLISVNLSTIMTYVALWVFKPSITPSPILPFSHLRAFFRIAHPYHIQRLLSSTLTVRVIVEHQNRGLPHVNFFFTSIMYPQ